MNCFRNCLYFGNERFVLHSYPVSLYAHTATPLLLSIDCDTIVMYAQLNVSPLVRKHTHTLT